jgi:hypothetical protein
MSRTFVFGGLIQQRRLGSQFLVYGDDLPRNRSKLQYNSKRKKDEMEPMEESIQFNSKKKAITTEVCLAGTHNVRSRFDAFHGTNGICDIESLSIQSGFQEWNRGFSSPGGGCWY